MENDETTEYEFTPKQQIVVVVAGALVGYAASYLTGVGYSKVAHKFHAIRANRSE